MKKYISLLLVLSLIFSIIPVPVSAVKLNPSDELHEEAISEKVLLVRNEDGTYTLVKSLPHKSSAISSLNDSNTISAYVTEENDSDLLFVKDNQYLSRAYEDTYVPAKRIDLDVSNFDANEAILSEYNLPQDTIQSARDVVDYQKYIGNEEFEFSFYISAPYVLPEESQLSPNSAQGSSIVEDITGKAYDCSSGYQFVVKGTSSKSFASSLVNGFLSTVGLKSLPVSLFLYGKTGYETFKDAVGVVDVSPGDWQQVMFKYDWEQKTSRVRTTAGYMTGCVSQKVKLKMVEYLQHYVDAGTRYGKLQYSKPLYPNVTYETAHWKDSASTALYNWATGAIVDPEIVMRIGTKQFRILGETVKS